MAAPMNQALARWLESIATQSGGDILAVQTLRNSIMAASVLASAALVGLMGVLATAHLHARSVHLLAAALLVLSAASAIHALIRLSGAGFLLQLTSSNLQPLARSITLGLRSTAASGGLLVLALAVAALGMWR